MPGLRPPFQQQKKMLHRQKNLKMKISEITNTEVSFKCPDEFTVIKKIQLVLSPEEYIIIADLLQTKLKVLENRLDKYNTIIESGEETEQDKNIFGETQIQLDTVENFISLTNHFQRS